ncbi:SRPBCC family protein [Halostella litorea]|uniref:SRPBCC family protein n=1 Tax=Halostella litorea TaxID=2528831 RepID=UPI001092B168|nr:SRPBCC family protein [Halostella litorea]
MRTVEVSRFVRALPAEVERALTPAAVVEYEGSFEARSVEETDDGWVVDVGGAGVAFPLRFEAREDGLHYEQAGDGGPLARMETTLSLAPENEGTRVTATSTVAAGMPLAAVTDRIAAWKRKGELRRALRALDEDLS